MAFAEFEEKSFEGPLNAQLLAGSPYLYTPGQVLESALGFDAAMLCHRMEFWSLWGRSVPPGLIPLPGWWHPSPVPLPALPQFNLNLFLQYKRSQRLERSNATEWQHWTQPYFRYDIVGHQQAALEACATSLGGNGLVAYAAPAFISLAELFQHTSSGTLVSETNFVEAVNLNSHGRYTYASAGTAGIALSEPTEIPPVSLSEDLGRRVRQAPEMSRGRNVLQLASDGVTSAMKKMWREPDAAKFEILLDEAVDYLDQVPPMRRRDEDGAKLRAYLRVTGFCSIVGWSWLVGGPAPNR